MTDLAGEESRRKLDEEIYPELMEMAQGLPGDAPRLEAMITKARVSEAVLAGEELDKDDKRGFNTDLPE